MKITESYYYDTVKSILNDNNISSANVIDDWKNKNIEINFDPSDIEDANSAASLDWSKYSLQIKKLSPYNFVIKKLVETESVNESVRSQSNSHYRLVKENNIYKFVK
mgnify:CR=1 FL=1